MTSESIVNAIENNLFEYVRVFAKNGENSYFENDEIIKFISDVNIPSMLSNSVYKNSFDDSTHAVEEIKNIIKSFKKQRKPLFLTLGPSSHPNNISYYLEKNRMACVQKQKGMALNLEKMSDKISIPDAIKIKEVKETKELKKFLNIYACGFNYSKSLSDFAHSSYQNEFLNDKISGVHYIAYVGEKPVATSSLFITGEIAGLYNIITVPEARNMGIATIMTKIPLIRAKSEGCKIAILQATKEGANVYRKIGFKAYCTFELYMKLHGISMISFPASYIAKRVSNIFRRRLLNV